jgi:cob(I)alamin adenosyltransferase
LSFIESLAPMVLLTRIYTRTGDKGETALGTGERVPKHALRIDEANAQIGVARLSLPPDQPRVAEMLLAVQNDMFDLGADLCTPDRGQKLEWEPLRIVQSQVDRLEGNIDELNAELSPLRSFVLPGGTMAAAQLHVARTVTRRAERLMVALAAEQGESVSAAALKYINRLSDLLFVMSRFVNGKGSLDQLWVPGKNR